MFETQLAVIGNIVNDPIRRAVGQQEVISFRVASNSRRRNADGNWEQGNSLFVTVSCWGRLVTGVGASLRKGSPVIVVGNVHSRDYEDREGVRRSTVEMRAISVGPDLSRCLARVEKIVAAGPEAPAAPSDRPDAPDTATDESEARPRVDGGLVTSA